MENKKQNNVVQPTQTVPPVQTTVPPVQEPTQTVPPVQQTAKPVLSEPTSIKNVKRHNTLGEYRKCIVHQTRHAQQNTNVFASIGLYTTEFLPGIEVSLPQAIITLLKKATTVQHYFDPNERSENGNKGAHLGRGVAKYIVEMV